MVIHDTECPYCDQVSLNNTKKLKLLFHQVSVSPLRDCTDLRDAVQVALAGFKETCGLAPFSNVKQCVRMLATRIHTLCGGATMELTMKGEVRLAFVSVLK